MGLLDEAIRQHLELKRQHGASDEELQMQEQEALGPVRREPVEPPPPEGGEPSLEPALGEDAEPTPLADAGADPSVLEEAPPDPTTDAPPYDELPADPADTEPPYHEPPLDPGVEEPEYDAEPSVDLAGEEPAYDELAPEAFNEPAEPFTEPTPEGDAATEALRPEVDLDSTDAGDTPSRGFEPVAEPPVADFAPAGSFAPGEGVAPAEGVEDEEDDEDEEDVLEETPEFLQETPEHDRLWFEQKPPRDFDFDE